MGHLEVIGISLIIKW